MRLKNIISFLTDFNTAEDAMAFIKQHNFTRQAKEKLIEALQADSRVEAGKYEQRME